MADLGAAARVPHTRHDLFAIAEAVGAGSRPAMLGACPACGALHRDLLSIQTAIRHAWAPRRPCDLRLSAADVARLRPVVWRRLLALVGSSRDTVTRPLAVGLTGLGIAGLVAANISIGAIGVIGAAGGAAASVPPETATTVEQPVEDPATGDLRAEHERGPDPLIVVSAASLAAGGSALGLRRLAARARAMR